MFLSLTSSPSVYFCKEMAFEVLTSWKLRGRGRYYKHLKTCPHFGWNMAFFKGLITVFGIHRPCFSFKVKKKITPWISRLWGSGGKSRWGREQCQGSFQAELGRVWWGTAPNLVQGEDFIDLQQSESKNNVVFPKASFTQFKELSFVQELCPSCFVWYQKVLSLRKSSLYEIIVF